MNIKWKLTADRATVNKVMDLKEKKYVLSLIWLFENNLTAIPLKHGEDGTQGRYFENGITHLKKQF